jgi:hypothetical protein
MTTPSSYVPGAGEGAVLTFPGVYPGTVVNNNDPLGVGRLQLYVPMVLANAVSAWAVPLGTYYSLPANHTPVAVAFLGGDPAQPAWIGPLDLSPIVNAAVTAVTYSSTEPPDPKVGDIWYQVFTLDGTVFYGPAQIWTFNSATSTFSWVASAQSGAGTNPLGVEEPSVSGGTITGAQFVGTGTDNELILYDGAPADYNMIASMVSQQTNMSNTGSGTTLPGVVYYGYSGGPDGLPIAIQMLQFNGNTGIGPNGGALVPWITGNTPGTFAQTNWTTGGNDTVFGEGIQLGSIIFGMQAALYNLYLSGSVGVSGGLTVLGGGVLSTAGTATAPTIITTDTWHNMSLLNGWTVGTGYAQYKLEPNNKVSVRAANITPGTVTAGTSIWTPPTGYVPNGAVSRQDIPIVVEVSTATFPDDSPRFDMEPSGMLVQNLTASTTRIGFNHYYALD